MLKYTIKNYETINELLDYLLNGNKSKHDNYQMIKSAYDEITLFLEIADLHEEFMDKNNKNYIRCMEISNELYPKIQKIKELKVNCYFISIQDLNNDFRKLLRNHGGYDINPYFDALELIKDLNYFYNIEPKKPINRLAYGWKNCRNKSYSNKYLSSIIRNYLKEYGVFNQEEWLNIIGLKDNLY